MPRKKERDPAEWVVVGVPRKDGTNRWEVDLGSFWAAIFVRVTGQPPQARVWMPRMARDVFNAWSAVSLPATRSDLRLVLVMLFGQVPGYYEAADAVERLGGGWRDLVAVADAELAEGDGPVDWKAVARMARNLDTRWVAQEVARAREQARREAPWEGPLPG